MLTNDSEAEAFRQKYTDYISVVPKTTQESHCPHCGYCPHCGRSNRGWGQYFPPYQQPFYGNGTTILCSANASRSH